MFALSNWIQSFSSYLTYIKKFASNYEEFSASPVSWLMILFPSYSSLIKVYLYRQEHNSLILYSCKKISLIFCSTLSTLFMPRYSGCISESESRETFVSVPYLNFRQKNHLQFVFCKCHYFPFLLPQSHQHGVRREDFFQ